MMPANLILIRHGESEGNIAVAQSHEGNDILFTDKFMNTPGHQWRLSKLGIQQAKVMGSWLNEQFPTGFNKCYVSPFVRTRETAGNLRINNAEWVLNRDVREQDWGDIASLPYSIINTLPHLADNLRRKTQDPIYWTPPNGESLAQVAEVRVNNMLHKLRERCHDDDSVLIQTHNEFMWATRLIMERWTDEQYVENRNDESKAIGNCAVIQYSRVNPNTGEKGERFTWMRSAYPEVNDAGEWNVVVSEWQEFETPTFGSDELMASVEGFTNFIDD